MYNKLLDMRDPVSFINIKHTTLFLDDLNIVI